MKKMTLYRSLEEYTDDLSYDSEVNFENLSTAFLVFFLILGSILNVFLVSQARCKKPLQIVQTQARSKNRERSGHGSPQDQPAPVVLI